MNQDQWLRELEAEIVAERKELIAMAIGELEADGLIRWTGEMRNGQKVYVATGVAKHPNLHVDGPKTEQ